MSKTPIARHRRSQVHISIKSTDNDSHTTTPPPTIRTPSSAVCAVLCGARGAMPGHSSVRLFIRTELEAAQKRYRHSHRLPPSHPKPVFSTVLVQLPSSLMSDTAESRPYHPETREASQPDTCSRQSKAPGTQGSLSYPGRSLAAQLGDLGDRVATMMMPMAPLPGDGSRIWGHGIVTHLRMALDRHLAET